MFGHHHVVNMENWRWRNNASPFRSETDLETERVPSSNGLTPTQKFKGECSCASGISLGCEICRGARRGARQVNAEAMLPFLLCKQLPSPASATTPMAAWSRHKWLACTVRAPSPESGITRRVRRRRHARGTWRIFIHVVPSRDHHHMNRWMLATPYFAVRTEASSSAAGLLATAAADFLRR
jgi:hypothetical protein